ncbi:hypothetical protein AWZ03_012257 [Drosophila navojoa]|uniref:Uncharacterized protein n=1 Tax=Drosophila navojoa TaxID=7232 RepID=A0A484AY25_DRONA|nr:hypothetical protein AWZ03_012257 [Drosophila navojoa]
MDADCSAAPAAGLVIQRGISGSPDPDPGAGTGAGPSPMPRPSPFTMGINYCSIVFCAHYDCVELELELESEHELAKEL